MTSSSWAMGSRWTKPRACGKTTCGNEDVSGGADVDKAYGRIGTATLFSIPIRKSLNPTTNAA